MAKKSKVITLRITETLIKDLKKVAELKGLNVSSLITMVMTEYVKEEKSEEIKKMLEQSHNDPNNVVDVPNYYLFDEDGKLIR